MPSPFGSLILKAAAYRTDSRDPDRHLRDAVALLACIDDPFAEREGFTGSFNRDGPSYVANGPLTCGNIRVAVLFAA